MRKVKQPTIAQLIDIVNAYNAARANELRLVPLPFPTNYKNDLMDVLYDAALKASMQLKAILGQIVTVDLDLETRQ